MISIRPVARPAAAIVAFAVLCLVTALRPTFGLEEGGWLDLRVRDSDAGRGLAARVILTIEDGTRRVLMLEMSGRERVALPVGRISIETDAPGYVPLGTRLTVRRGETLPVTLWLDPLEVTDVCSASHVASRVAQRRILLHGHVVDGANGGPVGDALVRLKPSGTVTRTDTDGLFELLAPTAPHAAHELPPSGDLIVESAGFKVYRQRDLPLVEGDTHVIVDLQPGSDGEVDEHDGRHKLLRVRDERMQGQRSVAGAEPTIPSAEELSSRPRVRVPGEGRLRAASAVWAPPAIIRVGFDCSCTNCATVQVLSLETYVKRGLNDEWIASWSEHSLRAGSIPYRSYGVWHVDNPLDDNYDICSNTCCQVNDADTSQATDSAVDRTAGVLLEAAGSILRSEYSAENNGWDDPADGLSCTNVDLSCGDGFAGSPSAGWPCLFDLPGAGHGCFGHGRGMCQWGTQRWSASEGRLWSWIVDHYYNDNDNPQGLRSGYTTSPLEILDAAPDPAGVEAGELFQIDLDVQNLAALEHSRVLIGASLWSLSTGYIDDSPNDQLVSLAPGESTVSRSFQVPVGTPLESYDLLTALWLDVDEDGAISGLDSPMALDTAVGAVDVCSEPVAVGDSLRLRALGVDAVELNWDASQNATSYTAYRSSTAALGWAAVGSTAGTTLVDADATGGLLFYEVSSRNGCGESGL